MTVRAVLACDINEQEGQHHDDEEDDGVGSDEEDSDNELCALFGSISSSLIWIVAVSIFTLRYVTKAVVFNQVAKHDRYIYATIENYYPELL